MVLSSKWLRSRMIIVWGKGYRVALYVLVLGLISVGSNIRSDAGFYKFIEKLL